ncbi:MAG: DUF2169 domain-containing protein [Deltaproteobacteria bacterium]|nr:DUF2169 domain-containing protein [Deltaproteobacteria bacterium]
MKIIKPQNLGLLFKSCFIDKRACLSIAACACFTLDTSLSDRLLTEPEMWPIIGAALDEDEIFDFGVPKVRGEFLVYGSGFAPKPVHGLEVHVRVGNLSKTLAIFGNYHWSLAGAQNPEPFTHMPINYGNAFGGPNLPENPLGKGMEHDGTGKTPIPNVQDPRHLMGSPGDRPKPAGFTAYLLTWPQRLGYLGKVDQKWLLEDWPHFPRDTDWEYFNTAPEDQRLAGFFNGEEKVEIRNMHPRKPVIQSTLPALRGRLFVNQKEQDRVIFKEVPCRAETLWLFPDREIGILLYRGTVAVAEDEYEDVLHFYAQWESLTDQPKSIEEYRRMFEENLTPTEAKAEAAPVETPLESKPAPVPAPPEAPDIKPELASLLKEAQEFEAKTTAMLKQAGLDPDAVVKQFPPVEARAATGSLADLGMAVAALEKQTAEFMKKFGLTAAAVEKIMAPKPEAPLKSADEIIAELRKGGFHKPEIEAQLKETERLVQESLTSLDNLEKQAAAEAAQAAQAPPPEPPIPPQAEAAVTLEYVLAKYWQGEPLCNLDLTGLDFSGQVMPGADFSNSILERAIFKKSKLTGARFTGALMTETDFSEAVMDDALLNHASSGKAKFVKASMQRADLTEGDFTASDFTAVNLMEATMTETIFEKAIMTEAECIKAKAPRSLFAGADLRESKFDEADLSEADLTGAQISHASFFHVRADGIRLFGVKGDSPSFSVSSLKKSRADKDTEITNGRFYQADLTDTSWEGVKLVRAQMYEAKLDRADFTGADLSGAILIRAVAREAKFAKANLEGANLGGINLFKGSLRKANLMWTDLKLSNLYGVDFYQAKLNRANLKEANIKRTLLSLNKDV